MKPSTGRTYVAITPSDDAADDFQECDAVFIGGAGTAVLVSSNGAEVAFAITAVPYVLDCGCVRVKATGTDATSMVALYAT